MISRSQHLGAIREEPLEAPVLSYFYSPYRRRLQDQDDAPERTIRLVGKYGIFFHVNDPKGL
jgi:hypothetical protein